MGFPNDIMQVTPTTNYLAVFSDHTQPIDAIGLIQTVTNTQAVFLVANQSGRIAELNTTGLIGVKRCTSSEWHQVAQPQTARTEQ